MRRKTKQKSYCFKKSLLDHIIVNAVKQATKTAREQLDESWHQTAYSVFQTLCIYSCTIGCKMKVLGFFFPVRMESEQWQLVPVKMIRDLCVLNRLRVISHRIWTCCAPVSNLRVMTAPSQHETSTDRAAARSLFSLLLLTFCRRFSSGFVSSWW